MIGPATFLACNLAIALAVPSEAPADSLSADGALVTLIEDRYVTDMTKELNSKSGHVWHRRVPDDYDYDYQP